MARRRGPNLNISSPMTPETAALVRQSWAQLAPVRKQVCADFYARLFARYPELRPLFKGDIARQSTLFMTMVNTVVSALDNPDPVIALLQTTGARHADYGIRTGDYDKFADVLMDTFARALGDVFTPRTRAAWEEVYARLAETMQQGAAEAGR
jgi:hemoglobin-like flavoprotein